MTSRKIVAVFESRDAALNARDSLLELGFDRDQVSITDRSSTEHTLHTPAAHGSFWANVKEMFMPERDRHTIEESIRRGGYVLVATVDEARADEAVARLEQANPVDLEERESQFRAGGWTGRSDTASHVTASSASASTASPGSSSGAGDLKPTEADIAASNTPVDAAGVRPETRVTDNDAGGTIPVLKEQLRVGKREVNRGSVRVRSYIVEEPVHEEVRLREERVAVERRPVDAPVRPVVKGSPEDLFEERTIEMTETAEQAVVGKEARMTEQVVVSKTATERVEQIDETVRHTEVEIEDGRSNMDTSRPRTTPDSPVPPRRA
jgi:uncharacterized protein (TIGR02271 family)